MLRDVRVADKVQRHQSAMVDRLALQQTQRTISRGPSPFKDTVFILSIPPGDKVKRVPCNYSISVSDCAVTWNTNQTHRLTRLWPCVRGDHQAATHKGLNVIKSFCLFIPAERRNFSAAERKLHHKQKKSGSMCTIKWSTNCSVFFSVRQGLVFLCIALYRCILCFSWIISALYRFYSNNFNHTNICLHVSCKSKIPKCKTGFVNKAIIIIKIWNKFGAKCSLPNDFVSVYSSFFRHKIELSRLNLFNINQSRIMQQSLVVILYLKKTVCKEITCYKFISFYI